MKLRNYMKISFLSLTAASLGLLAVLAVGCESKEPATGDQPAGQPAAAAEFVNVRCPIMGTQLDLTNVDPSLVRTHNGKKVAFCCGGCPSAWDALNDAEKDAKLAEASP